MINKIKRINYWAILACTLLIYIAFNQVTNVKAQSSSVTVPVLAKGESYKVTITNQLTCVDVEQQLGLKRGDVTQITTEPDGTIEVYFKKDVQLKDTDITGINTVSNKKVKEISVKLEDK